jgi:predicted nucleotidyltransferase
MHAPPPAFVVTSQLAALAKTLADWAVPAPAAVIYLYGSRVRGDHRAESDVDICVEFPNPKTEDVQWWTHHNQDDFQQIGTQVGAKIQLLERNAPLRPDVLNGPIVHQDRNVRCVWLPPKP